MILGKKNRSEAPFANFRQMHHPATTRRARREHALRLTRIVSELVDRDHQIKGKEMALVLTIIDVLMRRSFDFATQTRTQMVQEQLHAATRTLSTS
jgi:hypothetical protein